MSRSVRKRLTLFGALIGSGSAFALVVGLGVFAGAGTAASTAAPVNTSPPTISGTAQEGQTLSGNKGEWSGAPTDYNFFWTRCNKIGNACVNISGANRSTYALRSGTSTGRSASRSARRMRTAGPSRRPRRPRS